MNDIIELWISSLCMGLGAGFTIGFIAWGIGFAIYGIIKMFKMV